MAFYGMMKEHTWYYGLVVRDDPEFQDLQTAIEETFKDSYERWASYGTLVHPTCTVSAPPDTHVTIGPGTAITPDGLPCAWDSNQDVNAGISAYGPYVGLTGAGLVAGESRWVVIGVKHKFTDTDSAVDKLGNTVYYTQLAEAEMQVWASVAVTPGPNDWQDDATLAALLVLMRLADVEPICLACRRFGDGGAIQQVDIVDISRWIFEAQGHYAEHLDSRRNRAYQNFPLVRTETGRVVVAGVGTSSLDFAGGEQIYMAWKSPRFSDVLRQRSVVMPAVSVDTSAFGAGNWMARCYLDEKTGEVVVYTGATSVRYPRDPALTSLHDIGPSGANNAFPPTLVDMGLCQFTTNAGNVITAIVPVANTAQSWVSHVVHAALVVYDNTLAANPLAAGNVQDALDELTDEKLSIDGSIVMTGDLDMGAQDITNVGDVDGEDVGDLGTNAHAQCYPLRSLYRGANLYFHPTRAAAAPDCTWLGSRIWGTGGLRQGGAGGSAGLGLNKQYDIVAKIDSSSDPNIQNVTDDGIPDDDEQILARFNTDGTGIVRYMDLSHWSCESKILGMDMHLINVAGAAELEVTPGAFIKEGRVTTHPVITTITLTPAGLVGRKDSAWAFAVGWRYVYAINLARYNAMLGLAIAGHDLSARIFISDLAPDYTGGHPTWPTAQFLGAIYCTVDGAGAEEWTPMTKRGSKVVVQQQDIAFLTPDAGDSPLIVQLTGIVPITAQSALMSFQMIETTSLVPALVSVGGTPGASLTTEFPWRLTVPTSGTIDVHNFDIPLYRTTPIPSIYLFSTVAANGDVEVYPYVHGYTEDPLRPYYYEP